MKWHKRDFGRCQDQHHRQHMLTVFPPFNIPLFFFVLIMIMAASFTNSCCVFQLSVSYDRTAEHETYLVSSSLNHPSRQHKLAPTPHLACVLTLLGLDALKLCAVLRLSCSWIKARKKEEKRINTKRVPASPQIQMLYYETALLPFKGTRKWTWPLLVWILDRIIRGKTLGPGILSR